MRLIDADELIKYIKIWEIGTSISSDQKEFIDCVNEQPTAFDAEKVTDRLWTDFVLFPMMRTWNGTELQIMLLKSQKVVELNERNSFQGKAD